MLKIGLTGGIGSGKSIVAEMFKDLGAPVIDADVISHQLTSKGSPCLQTISEQLGTDFVSTQQVLDRKKLAQYIFEHPEKKKVLESILHPQIRKAMQDEVNNLDADTYAILAIPLLFETNFTDLIDRILVVDAPESIRIERVVQRDGRNTDEVQAIINQQVDQNTRLENADDIIENSGTIDELLTAVKKLHSQYLQLAST